VLTLTGCKGLSEICDRQVALLSTALTGGEHSQCLCLILARCIVGGIEGRGTVQLSGRCWEPRCACHCLSELIACSQHVLHGDRVTMVVLW
jgi:hypothetical protein